MLELWGKSNSWGFIVFGTFLFNIFCRDALQVFWLNQNCDDSTFWTQWMYIVFQVLVRPCPEAAELWHLLSIWEILRVAQLQQSLPAKHLVDGVVFGVAGEPTWGEKGLCGLLLFASAALKWNLRLHFQPFVFL